MLTAMQGYVNDNKIITESDISMFEGMRFVITFLNEREIDTKGTVEFSHYGHRTERGQHVDEYMEEMRANDRL